MNRRGNCHDNSFVESFLILYKENGLKEKKYIKIFMKLDLLYLIILRFFYNPKRGMIIYGVSALMNLKRDFKSVKMSREPEEFQYLLNPLMDIICPLLLMIKKYRRF